MKKTENNNSYFISKPMPVKYHALKYLIKLFYYIRLRRLHNVCYNSITKYGYNENGIKISKPTKITKKNYINERLRRGHVGCVHTLSSYIDNDSCHNSYLHIELDDQ